jgi:hypothetical protein
MIMNVEVKGESNCHTIVHKNTFVVDLKLHIQSIKQLTDNLSIYGLYELSVHLSIHAVRDSADDHHSKGCTCPKTKPNRMPPYAVLIKSLAIS